MNKGQNQTADVVDDPWVPRRHEKAGKGHFLAVSFRLPFRFYFSNACTNQLGLKMMTKTGSQTGHIFRQATRKKRGKLCPCDGVMASSSSPRCGHIFTIISSTLDDRLPRTHETSLDMKSEKICT
jgi:hypothetical protein